MGQIKQCSLPVLGRQDTVSEESEKVVHHDFEKTVVRRFRAICFFQEPVEALLLYLAKATRLGHLCCRVSGTELYPNPYQLVQEQKSDQQKSRSIDQWYTQILEGISLIPDQLLYPQGSIVRICYPDQKIGLYFHKSWQIEQELHVLVQKKAKETAAIHFCNESIEQIVTLFSDQLLQRQQQAIVSAIKNCLTVITGGPGTGKSYTAARFLEIYQRLHSEQGEKKPLHIALAAPTGKAAANLEERLATAVSGFQKQKVQAKTLHSLLQIGRLKQRSHTASFLEADIVIVDECSMIDALLMKALFQAVKPGARLILLGDNDQLPPVEAGSLFADMVDLLDGMSSCGRCHLTECIRAEMKAIIDLAESVNSGNANAVINVLHTLQSSSGVEWYKESDHQAFAEIVAQVSKDVTALQQNKDEIFHYFSTKRVLTPLRKGKQGLLALNEQIAKKHYNFCRRQGNRCCYQPIMAVANDYSMGIYNGQSGILQKKIGKSGFDGSVESEDLLLFQDQHGNWMKLPAIACTKVELAYALSVHKSQGSEFTEVLLYLPLCSASFGKEVVYTGITRAKKKITLFAKEQTLSQALAISSRRVSGFHTNS